MLPREKKLILQLLEVYKSKPFLWDKKHIHYRNQKCRNEGYRALLEVYKKIDEDATVQVVTKKIQNLRTNYIKELKKVMKSRRTNDGAGPKAAHVPTLWYFKTLRFLKKSMVNEIAELRENSAVDPLDSEDALSSSASDAESYHPEELPKSSISSQKNIMKKDVSSPSPSDADSDHPIPKPSRTSSVPSQEKRSRTKAGNLQIHHNSMTNTAENEPKMADRECEILGRSIGLQLRDLSKKQRTITQKLISDAIFYANMDLLSENSFVGLKPPNTQTILQPSPSSSTHLNKGTDHIISLPHKQSPQSGSSSPSYIVINTGTASPPPAEYLLSPNRQSPQYVYSSHESPPPSHI